MSISGNAVWDDIRVKKTFYFGNWDSGLPTAGKIDGYWLIYKHDDNNSSYDYFTIEGDFDVYDGARAGGSVGNKLKKYRGRIELPASVDEMIKAVPNTDALDLEEGSKVTFTIGSGPEVSISFEWPDGGDAELSTDLDRGEGGSYSITVEEDNWIDALPGKFQINYAAYLKSKGTYLMVDVSNKIWTNSGFYKNETFETKERIRNDY